MKKALFVLTMAMISTAFAQTGAGEPSGGILCVGARFAAILIPPAKYAVPAIIAVIGFVSAAIKAKNNEHGSALWLFAFVGLIIPIAIFVFLNWMQGPVEDFAQQCKQLVEESF